MKKKGLIVATIVMVLVLAVSLTTATYAWFTVSGAAEVETIGFKVGAASNLVIGVSKTNTFVDNDIKQWSDFTSDATTFTPDPNHTGRGSWSDGTEGLGLSIDTGLDLTTMDKAVYSFTELTYKTSDDPTSGIKSAKQDTYTKDSAQTVRAGFVHSHTALKASGDGKNVAGDSLEYADKNKDYLDVVFAVAANKADVLSFGCLITIDNDTLKSSLGMNAAIHVIYSIDGGEYKEYDIYGDLTAGSPNSAATAPTAPTVKVPASTVNNQEYAEQTLTYATKYADADTSNNYKEGDAAYFIPLRTATTANDYAKTGVEGIVQLHLIIYICGPDSDCVTAATGVGATIDIEFVSVGSAEYNKVAGITPPQQA